MPIDFRPLEKILIEVRNLETSNERITAEVRREFEHRGGTDDVMFSEPDLARRLYICHNAVFFLHAGLVEAREGLKSPEQFAPGADNEARDLWLQHLEQSEIEVTHSATSFQNCSSSCCGHLPSTCPIPCCQFLALDQKKKAPNIRRTNESSICMWHLPQSLWRRREQASLRREDYLLRLPPRAVRIRERLPRLQERLEP